MPGPRKQYPEQLRALLEEGTIARIDAVLRKDEPRVAMIREAIEREIARRTKAPDRK